VPQGKLVDLVTPAINHDCCGVNHFDELSVFCQRGLSAEAAAITTPEMLETIEGLHRDSEAREERMSAVLHSDAAAAQRYWVSVMSRPRGGASKISETLG
jgi:hypothetical protein